MRKAEIPRNEWGEFLRSYSAQHEGWLATVVRERPARPPEFHPLERIAPDRLHAGDFALAVKFRDEPLPHVLPRPVHLYVDAAPDGADEGLTIESEGGEMMAVRFRAAAHPEMLDALP